MSATRWIGRTVACALATGVAAAGGIAAQEKPAGPVVELETSLGKIVLELNAAKAPATVKNFLSYVEARHYDGTVFHRVIPTFMIQGGGHDEMLREKKTRAPIQNESANGLKNVRGAIAMARKREADSATAQFFINVVDNPGLDRDQAADGVGYAVFGKVTAGLDVVDKIKGVRTGERPLRFLNDGGDFVEVPARDVPLEPVVIRRAVARK